MPLARRIFLLKLLKCFDVLSMILCCFLSLWIVAKSIEVLPVRNIFKIRISIGDLLFWGACVILWHYCLVIFKVYGSKRLSSFKKDTYHIILATTIASVVIYAGLHFFQYPFVSPTFMFLFWFTCTGLHIMSRYLLKMLLAYLRLKGRNQRFVIIVGTNNRGVKLAEMIENNTELGYRLVGFVDTAWEGLDKFRKSGYPLVSDFSGFPTIIRDQVVDEVWIAIPMGFNDHSISKLLQYCEKFGLVIRHFNNQFGSKSPYLKSEMLRGELVITQYPAHMKGFAYFFKRSIDFVAAFALLIILSPLMIIVAALIKFTSSGPVFFCQQRIGYNKRRFLCYKFRTMVTEAEALLSQMEHLNEIKGPSFKMNNDPRITPIGKILRKISIDELPQLINVLKGEMSLVGPRPLPVRDFERFDKEWYRRRFCVLPGITGLMQIYERNMNCYEKSMKMDMQYIENWTILLDAKILIKTIFAVIKMSGAR